MVVLQTDLSNLIHRGKVRDTYPLGDGHLAGSAWNNHGQSQPNYDKQFVRDWLNDAGWDHEPPAPSLPDDIVEKTNQRYMEAYARLAGEQIA